MSFLDRIQEASLTTPSGKSLTFKYQDYEIDFEKRLVDKDGTDLNGSSYIIDQGRKRLNIPLKIFFGGHRDSDIEHKTFLLALQEKGIFVLFHPYFGRLNVIVKSVNASGNNVTSLGVYYITVNFIESVIRNFPSIENLVAETTATNILNSVDDFSKVLPSENLLNNAKIVVDDIKRNIGSAVDFTSDQIKEFEKLDNVIQNNITDLVSNPFLLLNNIKKLAALPSSIKDSLTNKLKGYYNYFDEALTKQNTDTSTLFLATVMLSCFEGILVADPEVDTKSSVIDNLNILENYIIEIDKLLINFDFESLNNYYKALDSAKNAVFENLSNFQTEFVYNVQKDEDLIGILNKIYSSNFESKIEEVIKLNLLGPDEIFNIYKGRELVYYA